jgi:hypothetical protein
MRVGIKRPSPGAWRTSFAPADLSLVIATGAVATGAVATGAGERGRVALRC